MGSVPELEGVWESPKVTPSSSFDGQASLSSNKETRQILEEKQVRKQQTVMRKNNKELLGELNKDYLYLEKLLANPVINKIDTRNDTETYISHRVMKFFFSFCMMCFRMVINWFVYSSFITGSSLCSGRLNLLGSQKRLLATTKASLRAKKNWKPKIRKRTWIIWTLTFVREINKT